MKRWRGPNYEGERPTLADTVIEFWHDHFKVPSGPLYGQPFILTDEQLAFFSRLYELDDDGRFVYRRASRRGSKGKGKSPEGALFIGAEFAGPVVFDGWDAAGEPVGKPRDFPWCQVAAVAEDQTDNVYLALREMLADSDLSSDNGGPIDLGKTRIEFTDGRPGKIEPVTSSGGAREGTPITAAVLDETHLWLPSKGGPKLAAALRRNLGKTGGRSLEVTNAPAIGENSVAEATLEAYQKKQPGLLYDSVEASWNDDWGDPKLKSNRERLRHALSEAYAGVDIDSGGWVDVDRQLEECYDADVPTHDVYRFYLNIARKAEHKAFDAALWKALAEDRAVDGPVILMFDGARTRDCAVLSAWTLDEKPHHFAVKAWIRPDHADDTYQHPRGEIYAAARDFIAAHEVALFIYDSSFHELQSMYDDWLDEYDEADPDKGVGLMVGYPTASGRRMEAAILRVQEDLRGGMFSHDGDPVITEHVTNAVEAKNRGGWRSLAKEKDSLKIDGAVTMTFGYDMVPTGRVMAANRQTAVEVWAVVD